MKIGYKSILNKNLIYLICRIGKTELYILESIFGGDLEFDIRKKI